MVQAIEVTKDLEERSIKVRPALFVRVTKLDYHEINYYVYTPGVSRPKSQKCNPHLYGPFWLVKDAFDWAKEKGIINYLVLKI